MCSRRRFPYSPRPLIHSVVWLFLIALVVQQAAVSPAVSAQSLAPLRTGDDLGLALNPDGTVARVTSGSRTIPSLASGGGFSMRMVGQNPNLLRNAGFEADTDRNRVPDSWRITRGATPPVLDATAARTGSRSLRVSNRATTTSGGFSTVVPVRPYTYYFLTAWSRARDVLPTSTLAGNPPITSPRGGPVQVKAEQLNESGEVLATYYTFGYTNTANWNKQSVGFKSLSATSRVRVTALLNAGSGTAWFDDIYLGELLAEEPINIRGSVARSRDGSLRQSAAIPQQNLDFKARYSATSQYIRVDGTVTDTARANSVATDRGFQITYTLPVDAVGWQWADYVRKSRTITPNTPYKFNTTQTPEPSRYPYATIFDGSSALSVAMPLKVPRMSRMVYDSRQGLSITFDLAVSKAATKLGGRGTFTFYLYRSNPAWGFRAATKKYYAIQPEAFVRRTDPAREGGWFIKPILEELDSPDTAADESKPFGLGLNMVSLGTDSTGRHRDWGTEFVPWDNTRNIYSAAYNHHWRFFQPRCPAGVARCPMLTYRQALAKLRADASITPRNDAETRLKEESQGALNSTSRDQNGRLRLEIYGRYLKYHQNPDPDFATGVDWIVAVQKHQVERAIKQAATTGGRLDGIHLDSTSGHRRWADDYGRAHWALTDMPLGFSYDSGRVVQRVVFSMYEHIRRLRQYLHSKDMFLSANFNANEVTPAGFVGADLIDYFGIEEGLPRWHGSAWGVTADSFAMLKRTVAYQRPVTTIDTRVGDGSLTAAQIDDRLQESLFYGIFPGPRGNRGGERLGWVTDENRAIYARYTPLFRKLAIAGWEPITNARSSNGNVWIERFGYVSTNTLHLTLHNPTDTPQRGFVVTVDLNRDGMASVGSVAGQELVTRQRMYIGLNAEKTVATFQTSIPAKSTRVVRITRTAP